MPKKDIVAVVDQSENFLTLQHYLIDSGIAAKLSDSKALIIYLALKRFARWSGPRSCFPSIPTLAKLALCSEMTVYRALETLTSFDPQLVKIEKITYSVLKERGLLPVGYRASNVEINLYTILPIAPALGFPEEPQPEPKAKSEPSPEQKKKPRSSKATSSELGERVNVIFTAQVRTLRNVRQRRSVVTCFLSSAIWVTRFCSRK
jgi:hypothetical protein